MANGKVDVKAAVIYLSAEEEDNKMICLANTDEFVLKQDICVMCGSLGNDLEGRLICCAQCGQCYHPQCVNVKAGVVVFVGIEN